MAVLNSLPGLAVSVSVAGKELPEYEHREDESDGPLANKTVLRYIESISDAEFAINFRISPPFQLDCYALNFRVSIDGKRVRGKICGQDKIKHGHWARALLGDMTIRHDGRAELRKFKFASLKTVEDSDSLRIKNDAVQFSHVGQMTIMIFRASATASSKHMACDRIMESVGAEVAEKAIKGKSLSHRTTYSAPVPLPKQSGTCHVTYLDGHDKPIVVFNFRYLSKESLRQQLIIPRSPSPDPYNALTDAEKERLGRQKLAELKAPSTKVEVKSEKKIKRERDMDGEIEIVDLSGESLTSNVSTRPLKIIRMLDGSEIIDLTD